MFGFEQFSLEMVLVLAVGLMILGPKDLPVVLRRLGQFVGKMRGMAAEFRASFDELARQSEIDELRKEVEALRTGNFSAAVEPAPVPDYNPFDNASSGLDNAGFSFPPQPAIYDAPIMGEGVPPAEAEVAVKPARKPRIKKTAEIAVSEPVATVKTRRAKSAAPKAPIKVDAAPVEVATAAPATPRARTKAPAKPTGKSVRAKSAST
ncbi:MAG: Sec-independent protein translocase protein TatB [Pseudomonadota bacterium]|nr:Sec-independent protein translocase protein TatB [Pseudomonadota bacterium]